MGNVDLLPQEKETVLQNLPQVGFCCLFSSFLGSIIYHVFAAFLLQGVGVACNTSLCNTINTFESSLGETL